MMSKDEDRKWGRDLDMVGMVRLEAERRAFEAALSVVDLKLKKMKSSEKKRSLLAARSGTLALFISHLSNAKKREIR